MVASLAKKGRVARGVFPSAGSCRQIYTILSYYWVVNMHCLWNCHNFDALVVQVSLFGCLATLLEVFLVMITGKTA